MLTCYADGACFLPASQPANPCPVVCLPSRNDTESVLQKKNDCSSCARAKERGRGGRMTSTGTHEERSIWAKITKLLEIAASRQTSSETEAGARKKGAWSRRTGGHRQASTPPPISSPGPSIVPPCDASGQLNCSGSNPVAIGAIYPAFLSFCLSSSHDRDDHGTIHHPCSVQRMECNAMQEVSSVTMIVKPVTAEHMTERMDIRATKVRLDSDGSRILLHDILYLSRTIFFQRISIFVRKNELFFL